MSFDVRSLLGITTDKNDSVHPRALRNFATFCPNKTWHRIDSNDAKIKQISFDTFFAEYVAHFWSGAVLLFASVNKSVDESTSIFHLLLTTPLPLLPNGNLITYISPRSARLRSFRLLEVAVGVRIIGFLIAFKVVSLFPFYILCVIFGVKRSRLILHIYHYIFSQ